jgi:hypothetical protein
VIAAAVAPVPDLFEGNEGEPLRQLDYRGRVDPQNISVYACWRREEGVAPVVYVTTTHGPFSLSTNLSPEMARAFAAHLVQSAELAEGQQIALDAERAELAKGQ